MITQILLFLFLAVGLYFLFTGLFPRVNYAAERAVRARGKKKLNSTEQIVSAAAPKIVRFISLDPTKKLKLKLTLNNLQMEETPELLHARAWIVGATYGLGILLFLPLIQLANYLFAFEIAAGTIFQIGTIIAVVLLFVGKSAVFSELDKMVKDKRLAIEWELPQFSGTIVQQIAQNKNVSVLEILESYQKISGSFLKDEIALTLNEMRVGSIEKALKSLTLRVNSGSITQVTQGLIAMTRGDNQYTYFQMITQNFEVNQAQLIKQEILDRPQKLTINNILLLMGMIAMFGVAIGGQLMDASAAFF